jgi:hypothetical protein
MDSLTTSSGSVRPTAFRLFKRVVSSFINTFYVCSGSDVKQNSGIKEIQSARGGEGLCEL